MDMKWLLWLLYGLFSGIQVYWKLLRCNRVPFQDLASAWCQIGVQPATLADTFAEPFYGEGILLEMHCKQKTASDECITRMLKPDITAVIHQTCGKARWRWQVKTKEAYIQWKAHRGCWQVMCQYLDMGSDMSPKEHSTFIDPVTPELYQMTLSFDSSRQMMPSELFLLHDNGSLQFKKVKFSLVKDLHFECQSKFVCTCTFDGPLHQVPFQTN